MKDRYDYARLCADLARLEKPCPYIRRGSIGKSLYGRDLHRVTIGRGKKQVFYNGAHHGMEGMTARLLVRFAEECCAALEQDGKLGGIQASKLFDDIRLEIVPMINPDGVEISVHGVRREDARYGRLVQLNGGEDFTRWQANGRGVDLNHNYNALWETCRETERAIGITGPGPTRYGGSAPERPDTFYLNEHMRSTVGHSLSSNIFHGVFCTIMTVLSGGTTLLNDGLWHMKHMHDEEDEGFSAEMCAKILRRLEDPPVRSRRRAVKGLVKAFKDDDMLAGSFPAAMYGMFEKAMGCSLLLLGTDEDVTDEDGAAGYRG